MSDPVSRSKSEKAKQKQKQKQKQSPSSTSVGVHSGTMSSSTHTLTAQTSIDSIPSVVTPESKPEAPILSDHETSPPRPNATGPQPETPVLPDPEKAPSRTGRTQPITAPPKLPTIAPFNPLTSLNPPLNPPPVHASAPAPAPARPVSARRPTVESAVRSKPESPVSGKPTADIPTPSISIPSESRPVGGRRGKSDDDTNGATRGGALVHGGEGTISSAGLQMPGKLLNDPDEKGALKIKVHLNLHAKVRLDLDAQIYGDVVIGLL
ncbi:unnamed protein product [Penicillium manginii]